MRTAGQGQAAVPGERVRRRRSDGLPEPSVLGRGRISHGLSRGVERYPEAPGHPREAPAFPWRAFSRIAAGSGLGARFRAPWFLFCARGALCGSQRI